MSQSERRLAAIMFTDMVGYTSLTQSNEHLALGLLEKHRGMIRPVLSRFGGREVKTIGDAFLVEFGSALDATECAFEIQKILNDYNTAGSDQISLRIGIHVGDVIHAQGDVYGDAVNIASRIEPIAKGGGICISGQVFDQVRNKVPYRMAKLQPTQLKNVALNIDVYKLELPWEKSFDNVDSSLPVNRIAVLPLVNISPDPNDEFFADGLTEELITSLSLVKGLKVIARTSVMNYKKKEKNVSEIGRNLGVGTIVEGSVRKAGNRIRVTVQLIDVKTEEHLWASNYDRSLDDIFAVQSDIASKVAESIPTTLAKSSPIKARYDTENMKAYTHFLQGKQLLHSTTEDALKQSLNLFKMAVELDPSFARAHVGIAEAYIELGNWNFISWNESLANGQEAVQNALKLDPRLPEAHAVLSYLAYMADDLDTVAKEARIAIDANPNLADAYSRLGEFVALKGSTDEWVRILKTAYQLDPLSSRIIRRLGAALFYNGNSVEALDHWNRTLHLDPYNNYLGLTEYYLSKGDYEQAEKTIREMEKLQPSGENTFLSIGYLAALRGDRKKAEDMARKLEENYPKGSAIAGSIGLIYYALGDLDRFFELMFQSAENHTLPAVKLLRSPLYAAARKDPRFKELLLKIGVEVRSQD